MMQGLRDNMKLIIWITAVVFLVGFGILQLGGVLDQGTQRAPSGVIAMINGEPVHIQEFNQVYNTMVQQLTKERPMQEGEDSYVREQAWQQIVRNTLIEQEAKRRGIQVTPDEIKASIRLTPPDFIVQAPAFQTDGKFDYRKYLSEVDNPNSQLPWNQVEAFVAATLPAQKLQDQVIAEAKVSEGDIRERFMLLNDKMKLQYLAFDPDGFPVDTTRIGGADIESYYKAHPDEFTGPAQIKVQVTMVPRVPNKSDFAAGRERLQGILDQLKAQPDSFESYAKTYSEIGSAQNGGNPMGEPYFDDLRPAFRNGLRNVKAGEISPIMQEVKSLHIFRVDKLYPDPKTARTRIKYHEIAIRVNPGADAIRDARDQVNKVQKDASREGLGATATKYGLRTFTSDYFAEGQSQNSVFERFPELETWCFQAKPGDVSRPVPTEDGWYVYQVADHRNPGLRPLTAVKDDVKKALIHSLRVARAEQVADQARAAAMAGTKLDALAQQYRARTGVADEVTRNGNMTTLGRDPKSVGVIFTLPAPSWTPVFSGPAGVFFAYVESHQTPSEQEYQKQAPTIRDSILNERRRVAFAEWIAELRRKAKIVDYRENFFEA